MTKRFSSDSLAVLLLSCLPAAEIVASSVPYNHDSAPGEGWEHSASMRESLFGFPPRSIGVEHEESQNEPWHKQHGSRWDRDPGHEYADDDDRDSSRSRSGYGLLHGNHGGRHDDSWFDDRDAPRHPHSDWHHSRNPCPSPNPVPVPPALWLFLSGTLGIALMGSSHRRHGLAGTGPAAKSGIR